MRPGTILIVDSNDEDMLLMLQALRHDGIENEVIHAKSDLKALDMLFGSNGNIPITPSLILLDVNIENRTGIALLKTITENSRTKNIPMSVLTSTSEDETIVKQYVTHSIDFIRKPINKDSFLYSFKQMSAFKKHFQKVFSYK